MTYQTLSEAVEALKNGDQSAFQAVYDNSYRYIYYTIIKSVQNKELAEDILQETYIEIYKNISSLKEADAFKGWAVVIAQNKISRYFRKKSDSLFSSDDEMDAAMDNMEEDDTAMLPADAADNKETQRLIMEIIDSLPDGQREAIVSFYYNQMSIAEIAEALEVSDNTVKTWLSRGKKKIKQEVVNLAEKHGTKLYAVPFMVILSGMFSAEADACELPADAFSAINAKIAAGSANGISAAANSAQSSVGAAGGAAAATTGAFSSMNWGLIAAVGVAVGVGGLASAAGIKLADQYFNGAAIESTSETIETSEAFTDYEDETEELTEFLQEFNEEDSKESEESTEASTEEASTEDASTEDASTEAPEDEDKYEIPEVISKLRVSHEDWGDRYFIDDHELWELYSSAPVVDRGDYYEVSDTEFIFFAPDLDPDPDEYYSNLGYEPVTVRIRKNAVVETNDLDAEAAAGHGPITMTIAAEEYYSKHGNFEWPFGSSGETLASVGCEFDSEGYITLIRLIPGD